VDTALKACNLQYICTLTIQTSTPSSFSVQAHHLTHLFAQSM